MPSLKKKDCPSVSFACMLSKQTAATYIGTKFLTVTMRAGHVYKLLVVIANARTLGNKRCFVRASHAACTTMGLNLVDAEKVSVKLSNIWATYEGCGNAERTQRRLES
eukprot:PhM_4_TR15893/c0_g3_i1/m.72049